MPQIVQPEIRYSGFLQSVRPASAQILERLRWVVRVREYISREIRADEVAPAQELRTYICLTLEWFALLLLFSTPARGLGRSRSQRRSSVTTMLLAETAYLSQELEQPRRECEVLRRPATDLLLQSSEYVGDGVAAVPRETPHLGTDSH